MKDLAPSITELATRLGVLLAHQNLTLSTAESCTGGGIAAALTDIPGSSQWFVGGFVTYANEWKMKQLAVAEQTLKTFGAVSPQTVNQMLQGLLKNGGADLGIAVSGIAGPGGALPGKPVGTVFIGIASRQWRIIHRAQFQGDRNAVRQQTIHKALQMLLEQLKDAQQDN